MSKTRPYLQSARIEGYKSIVSSEVAFKPGLNIIIGKNGSGKTNLLEGIYNAMRPKPEFLDNEPAFGAKLNVANDTLVHDSLQVNILPTPIEEVGYYEAREEDKPRKHNQSRVPEIWICKDGEIREWYGDDLNMLASPTLFPHSISRKIPFISDFESGWMINGRIQAINGFSRESKAFEKLQRQVADRLLREVRSVAGQHLSDQDVLHIVLEEMEQFQLLIRPYLRAFTPITDIVPVIGRVTQGLLKNQQEAKGFYFLFRVNDQLLPFDKLSDGTKRIFLIVSEVLAFTPSVNDGLDYEISLFLLEEPELGIHPHQLQLLMNLLKEQSREKQIILTTHSPQVLDVLSENEFDRIIISEFDPRKGSIFRHLTDAEIEKARQYVEAGLQISDYWKFSDLEPAIA